MFGFGKKKKIDEADVFKKISDLLADDDLQQRILGPQVYSQFKAFSAIDQRPNGIGEFGKSLQNPIPTNGPIGTISYLSNLAVSSGHRITFHRIGTAEKIDIYEYVSLSGRDWGLLFIDMYHSRKSRLIPEGFNSSSTPLQLIGFNHFWDDFPSGYSDQKQALPQDLRILYVSMQSLSKEMIGRDFKRPQLQALILREIGVLR